jgi:REP-associated tyrosine transposase
MNPADKRLAIQVADHPHSNSAASKAEVRSIVCYLAVRHLGEGGATVGRQLGLGRSGVSVAAGRGEKRVKEDSALLSLIDQ